MMITRRMYRAQVKEGAREDFVLALEENGSRWEKELRDLGLINGCLFEKKGGVFVYAEYAANSFEWEWPGRCRKLLEIWPGEKGARLEVPMLDIYHDGEAGAQEVGIGRAGRERLGSLARLKPELFASYVFYHYAKQEETPGSFNPTYIIGAHENILFSYQELPAPKGESRATRRTWPAPVAPDNWHETMQPHFLPWSDGERGPVLWEKMSMLLSFGE
ncbi:hypothetical protein [Paenibacillus ginsengarvi]|uniref:Uncharacterized protein n=1 Tax=Paenibacillus ginsengarvi TaxID=400777 RepID=A0A3B0BUF2_9BACL|nr:hypothetical protein [Paenibacillus ginsengarvi]RKN75839.1 hypothetical protein D7M11_25370 [Paenibacillus ginsengarvi]